LQNEKQNTNIHTIEFNAETLPSNTYFAQIRTTQGNANIKMIIQK